MVEAKPYTLPEVLRLAAVDDTAVDCVADQMRLRATVSELERLQSFHAEWAEKDGNSPGYNLEKAKTYGRIAAGLRVELEEAKDSLGKANREVHDHYMHLVNFANREASRFQTMLLNERKEVERLKALVELFEANMEPVVDASLLLRPPRTIPKLQKLFARKSKK